MEYLDVSGADDDADLPLLSLLGDGFIEQSFLAVLGLEGEGLELVGAGVGGLAEDEGTAPGLGLEGGDGVTAHVSIQGNTGGASALSGLGVGLGGGGDVASLDVQEDGNVLGNGLNNLESGKMRNRVRETVGPSGSLTGGEKEGREEWSEEKEHTSLKAASPPSTASKKAEFGL